ncbi:MAG: hypothetical protein K1X61_07340 [Chitinophagales bacterium]|nr:hypothetical protein [Chitinophagales bacterium]
MKQLALIIAGVFLLQAHGFANHATCNVPKCIQKLIKQYKSKPKQEPATTIYEYEYNGAKVYYVTAPCCDQMGMLYDAKCNLLCHPDGGITGTGDGKCADFNSTKTNEVLIWKDDR